jgi:hypothetical protein
MLGSNEEELIEYGIFREFSGWDEAKGEELLE